MKLYRVVPEKRKHFTVYGLCGMAAVLLLLGSVILNMPAVQDLLGIRLEEWLGIALILVFALLAWHFFGKHNVEKYSRCTEVFARDDSNHLYYIHLNRAAFHFQPSLLMMLVLRFTTRRSMAYYLGEFRRWKQYCLGWMCGDALASQIPVLVKEKYSNEKEAALLACRIREIERVTEGKGSTQIAFYPDGGNQLQTASAYDYMNDYEELVNLLRDRQRQSQESASSAQ